MIGPFIECFTFWKHLPFPDFVRNKTSRGPPENWSDADLFVFTSHPLASSQAHNHTSIIMECSLCLMQFIGQIQRRKSFWPPRKGFFSWLATDEIALYLHLWKSTHLRTPIQSTKLLKYIATDSLVRVSFALYPLQSDRNGSTEGVMGVSSMPTPLASSSQFMEAKCPTGCCVAQLPPLYKWSLPTIWCPTTALSCQRTHTFSTDAVWSQEPIIGQQFTLLKTSWTWCLDFYFDLGATASAGGMTPRHTRNCHLAASQAQRAKKVLNNAI